MATTSQGWPVPSNFALNQRFSVVILAAYHDEREIDAPRIAANWRGSCVQVEVTEPTAG